jgi:MFS family permease
VNAFTISLTSVADLMRQEHRAASVAFIMVMFSIGIIVGPTIGAFMDPSTAGD